ncbi:hypothetical protein K2X30_06880 [bacterium]|nr:hypothetical protein [bacterium]
MTGFKTRRLLALGLAFALVSFGISTDSFSAGAKKRKSAYPRKLLTAPTTAKETVISLTSVEMHFEFDAEFETSLEDGAKSTIDLAIQNHYQHLLGYFQNRKVVEDFGISFALSQGVAMPRLPLLVTNVQTEKTNKKISYAGQVSRISYHAAGRLLVHKEAYEQLKKVGVWNVTMPYDLDHYYDIKCTSPDYTGIEDFWYFYNPFRNGCRKLNDVPLALPVTLHLKDLGQPSADFSAGLKELRLAPGKDTLKIYSVNGFADDASVRGDEGRRSYDDINKYVVEKMGFTHDAMRSSKHGNRPMNVFTKDYVVEGRMIRVEILRLLADTSIDKPNITFAKFFKEAVEDGDVIIYAGHSGLGGNLDFENLNAKLRENKIAPIQFSKTKKQIYYLDGCSSYSYYLLPFGQKKKDASRIDILTNGLESLFDKEFYLQTAFYEVLVDFSEEDPSWTRVLERMEAKMQGQTFLLNVGPL